jgi:hypothetical protein
MCRRPIPADFLVDPDKYVVGIIHEPNLENAWFYEGNNGTDLNYHHFCVVFEGKIKI